MLSVTKNVIRIFILNAAPGDDNLETSTGDKKPIYFFDQVPFKRSVLVFILFNIICTKKCDR